MRALIGCAGCVGCGLLAVALLPAAAQPPAPSVRSRLLWFDRDGHRLARLGPVADHGNLELSPDGTRVAVAVRDPDVGTFDIWLYDVDTDARSRFTDDAADENWLIWSPDGSRVLLNSFSARGLFLFEAPANGSETRRPLVDTPDGAWPVSWSRDGRFVLYVTNSARTSNDIWVLPLDADARPYPFLQTEASENWAAFSPDGRWVAFSATDSGGTEVYISPFPADGRRWRLSAGGGSQARWRADGTEVYYLAPDSMLVAVGVSPGDGMRVTRRNPLFRLSAPYGAYHAFDVAMNGERFLVNTVLTEPAFPGTLARRASAGLNRFR